MIWFWRIITGLWAFLSVATGALVFFVLSAKLDQLDAVSGLAILREAFETIPEGALMAAGFAGMPIWGTIIYWVVLAASVMLAWKPRIK